MGGGEAEGGGEGGVGGEGVGSAGGGEVEGDGGGGEGVEEVRGGGPQRGGGGSGGGGGEDERLVLGEVVAEEVEGGWGCVEAVDGGGASQGNVTNFFPQGFEVLWVHGFVYDL